MNEIPSVVVAIVSLVLLAIFAISYLRAVGPHSRKMAREQAELDRKTGVTPKRADAPAGAGENGRFKGIKPHLPSILLVIVGVVAAYWGFQNTQIRPADAGSWSQNHWLLLLIFWGMGHALFALNAKAWGVAASTLHWVLASVMVLLFVVLPFIGWVNEPPKPARGAVHPVLLLPANGFSDHVLPPVGYATTFRGHGYTIHCVYSDGTEGIVGDRTRPCRDGDMLYQYLRDTTGQPNSVTYEFVRPGR